MEMLIFNKIRVVLTWMLWVLWLLTALAWPVVKWVLSLDVFYQFLKMIYYWNTPSAHNGWIFLLHFFVLVVVTVFVSNFKPKGI